jgi:hypothetical protein
VCDEDKMPLLDLKDIKKILDYITERKDDIAKLRKDSHFNYGNHSEKIIELDQHRAKLFISEMSDKMSIPLIEIQDKPKLFLL